MLEQIKEEALELMEDITEGIEEFVLGVLAIASLIPITVVDVLFKLIIGLTTPLWYIPYMAYKNCKEWSNKAHTEHCTETENEVRTDE